MPSAAATQSVSCPICGHDRAWRVSYHHDAQVEAWRREAGETIVYDWRLCQHCGNAYPTAQPSLAVLRRIWEYSRTLAATDAAAGAAIWQARHSAARLCAQRSYTLFAPLATRHPGRFLDIGCGLGETVRTFADHGWDAEGIDADPTMAPIHRELGIRSRIGQFETLEIGDGYDVIHSAHAIYFVTDPMRFLKAVREKLAPGGVCGVVIADFMAVFDPGLPSYAHSFFPTAASMRYALALAGFKTVHSRRCGGSIYIAARPGKAALPSVHPKLTRWGILTKPARYALLGRPYLALRRAAKRALGRG